MCQITMIVFYFISVINDWVANYVFKQINITYQALVIILATS